MEAWVLPGCLEGSGEIRQKARTSGAKILGACVSFSVSGNAARILRRLQGQDWEMKVTPNSLQESAGESDPSKSPIEFWRNDSGWGLGAVDCESCSSMASVSWQEAPYRDDPGSGLLSWPAPPQA